MNIMTTFAEDSFNFFVYAIVPNAGGGSFSKKIESANPAQLS